MNVIRKLTAWTNKTVALGIVAVSLAGFGTLVGPAPKVADIGTPWTADLDKASSLDKRATCAKDVLKFGDLGVDQI